MWMCRSVRKRPGGPARRFNWCDKQKLENANIALPKGAVITGMVIDESGEPAPGTQVRVMRFVMQTGERTLQSAGQAQADDRGFYRVWGLQPGEIPHQCGSKESGHG
jgi:protocatechuate 3,4-dioxygenase beta subunit